MKTTKTIHLVFDLLTLGLAFSEAANFAIAPGKLSTNSVYNVNVFVGSFKTIHVVTAVVECAYRTIARGQIEVREAGSYVISLQIGSSASGPCILEILGNHVSGVKKLYLVPEEIQVYVQTDKPMYKPGDTVRFRTLLLDENLRPVAGKTVITQIKTPDGSILKTLREKTSHFALLSTEYTLSNNAQLGNWTLTTKVDDRSFANFFQVAEYVLPAFTIELVTPPFGVFRRSKIPLHVKAYYTYGKPVIGYIFLSVGAQRRIQPILKNDTFLGERSILLDIDKLGYNLLTRRNGDPTLDITATVVDQVTKNTYTAVKSVPFRSSAYKARLLAGGHVYVPGFRQNVRVKVERLDGQPVSGSQLLILSYGPKGTEKNDSSEIIDGVATFSLDISTNWTHQVELNANYEGKVERVGTISSSTSLPMFLDITVANSEAVTQVGDVITLRVNCSCAIDTITYFVMGRRSSLVGTAYVGHKQHYVLKIPSTSDMRPTAHVLAYTFCGAKLTIGSIEVPVSVFENQVEVEFIEDSLKPGMNAKLQISSAPGSIVAISAVDEQSTALGATTDISRDKVLDQMEKYIGCASKERSSCVEFGSISKLSFDNQYRLREAGLIPIENIHAVFKEVQGFEHEVLYSLDNGFSPHSIDADQATEELGYVRRHFPETWLWHVKLIGESGREIVEEHVPDSITAWRLSALSLHGSRGLALSPVTSVKVFTTFFLKLNLPFSIIRGEALVLQATVYNYDKLAIEVNVTLLDTKGQWVFEDIMNESSTDSMVSIKTVNVPSGTGKTVCFKIKPRKVGNLDVDIEAKSDARQDHVIRKLLVKPGGEVNYFNELRPIVLQDDGHKYTRTIEIPIPNDIIDSSEFISVSVMGDLLSTAYNNLDRLLVLPMGCGEQNMEKLASNIIVLHYFKSRELDVSVHVKLQALNNIEKGYKTQLSYKHSDGSYSIWGRGEGSTWLTAYVIKHFKLAQNYHESVSDEVVQAGVRFLLERQQPDGSFVEKRAVSDKRIQGGSAQNAGSLTAYVFTALITQSKAKKLNQDKRQRTEAYLLQRVETTDDVFELCIIAYALASANSKAVESVKEKLWSKRQHQRGKIHWKSHSLESSIEATSYAVMAFSLSKESGKVYSAVRWLLSQQNANGGFSSTQDTVVGLEALATFASQTKARSMFPDPDIQVAVMPSQGSNFSVIVDTENRMHVHQFDVESKARSIAVTAEGVGSCFFQISWQYNLDETLNNAFEIRVNQVEKHQDTLCFVAEAKYLLKGEPKMTMLEIVLPSGYVANMEPLRSIKSTQIGRVETKDGNSVVIIYSEEFSREVVARISAKRMTEVENLQNPLVIAYDYYDRAKKSSLYYSLSRQGSSEN